MPRWLSDLEPLGVIAILAGAVALSLRCWEQRTRVQFGPCMPPPVPKRVRASLRRRAVIYALEAWHRLRRSWPVPPADGERFSTEEVRLIHDIWTAFDRGETAPEHYYPGIPRDAEDK